MSRGKRKRRKTVEPGAGANSDSGSLDPTPASGPAIYHRPSPEADADQILGMAQLAAVMLAGCPFFQVGIVKGRVIVDRQGIETVCKRCGRISNAFGGTCPGMISEGSALRMMLPPEVLHADPESGLIGPDGKTVSSNL